MRKTILLVVLLTVILAGCATGASAEIGTDCDSLQPTTGDIRYALDFGSRLFTEAVWQRSYTVRELDVIVSWTHRGLAALSDVSLLLFCNENGTGDIDLFYNNETILANFSNYDTYNITASCSKDGLLLYELDAVEEDAAYKIREWVQPLSKTRLLSVVIVFPADDAVLLEKYGQELFPALPVCE